MLQTFCTFFLVNSMPHSGCCALHGVNPNLKKIASKDFEKFRLDCTNIKRFIELRFYNLKTWKGKFFFHVLNGERWGKYFLAHIYTSHFAPPSSTPHPSKKNYFWRSECSLYMFSTVPFLLHVGHGKTLELCFL